MGRDKTLGSDAGPHTTPSSATPASRETAESIQRTRLSAERTLESTVRTSLALIGFGFTVAIFFSKLVAVGLTASSRAPRNFGLALVLLGVGILTLGIVYHVLFMRQLERERQEWIDPRLLQWWSSVPVSATLVFAVLLLAIGLLAIISMTTFSVVPFD